MPKNKLSLLDPELDKFNVTVREDVDFQNLLSLAKADNVLIENKLILLFKAASLIILNHPHQKKSIKWAYQVIEHVATKCRPEITAFLQSGSTDNSTLPNFINTLFDSFKQLELSTNVLVAIIECIASAQIYYSHSIFLNYIKPNLDKNQISLEGKISLTKHIINSSIALESNYNELLKLAYRMLWRDDLDFIHAMFYEMRDSPSYSLIKKTPDFAHGLTIISISHAMTLTGTTEFSSMLALESQKKIARELMPIRVLETLSLSSRSALLKVTKDNHIYALKIWLLKNTNTQSKCFQVEANILRKLHHKHIVSYAGEYFSDECQLGFLYTEYISGENLHYFIARNPTLDVNLRQILCEQLLTAADYLYKANIFHGDMKTSNIMICNGEHLKLIDFDIANDYSETTQHRSTYPIFCGTQSHMDLPPLLESMITGYYQCESFNAAWQYCMYSIGAILHELWHMKLVFHISFAPVKKHWDAEESYQLNITWHNAFNTLSEADAKVPIGAFINNCLFSKAGSRPMPHDYFIDNEWKAFKKDFDGSDSEMFQSLI